MEGTLKVLEIARRTDARVILASSAAIYGYPERLPIDERHTKNPQSPYGLDKLALDNYGRLYHDLYGLETVILRYFNVYGPRRTAGDYSGVISIFLYQATSGNPITVDGDGTQTRDFVHVSDVVQAKLLAAQSDHVGEAFNIGTGADTSIIELAEAIKDVTDSPSEIIHTYPRTGDIERSVSDITKAEDQLGYAPSVSLREDIESLV